MSIQNVVEQQVLRALEEKEAELDSALAASGYGDPNDVDLKEIRRRRVAQLKAQQAACGEGFGERTELSDDKEFFKIAKTSKKVALILYRPSFELHDILMLVWNQFSRKHLDVRVLSINAEKAPFLTERLKIWCLPTVVLVKDGKTEHSIIGMDEVGGAKPSLSDLEDTMRLWKMISE